jgi:hypothetical protein
MNKKINNITIGSDPEFFLYSQLENKFISAVGMYEGTKKDPKVISENGHMIQVDGVSCEVNIPPCVTAEQFNKELQFVVGYIRDTIAKPKNLIISEAVTAEFTEDQLNCREAWEIGCDPDLSAWTLNVNNPKGYENNIRACGGHISVGYDNPNEQTSIALIKAMDLFLSVPSVLIDEDVRRRALYGKAGAMRFKSFGVEHRTLSNFWLFNPVLRTWAFENTLKACEFVNINGIITNEDDIMECINTGNKAMAQEIIEDYNLTIPNEEEVYHNEFA